MDDRMTKLCFFAELLGNCFTTVTLAFDSDFIVGICRGGGACRDFLSNFLTEVSRTEEGSITFSLIGSTAKSSLEMPPGLNTGGFVLFLPGVL